MNVEVIIDDLENNPHCLHGNNCYSEPDEIFLGPSLLFKRAGNKNKAYYACSVSRDHKECHFYLDAQSTKEKKLKMISKWTNIRKDFLKDILNKKPYKKYLKILKSCNSIIDSKKYGKLTTETKSVSKPIEITKKFKKESQNPLLKRIKEKVTTGGYCYTCEVLFESTSEEHDQCKVVKNLTKYQLKHPTEIIRPKEDSKTHAQYFFSKKTVETIILLLRRMNAERVLCIGVPRIHEYIKNECKDQFQSILLDIDLKYYNFYSRKQFIWYNMFNNYVLDEDSRILLKDFLSNKNVIVLIDPPFGGRAEPLAYTINGLNKLYTELNYRDVNKGESKQELGVMWIFPYFMERHVKASLPNMNMSDLKIDYDNHSSFTDVGSRKRKFGSPIRIFTNLPLSRLDLEGVDGYRYCRDCGHWVAQENLHCRLCGVCPSKNGSTYRHCEKCSRCVKPSYQHCEKCQICTLPSHECGRFRTDTHCYHCKRLGHKKRDCPEAAKRKSKTKKFRKISKS